MKSSSCLTWIAIGCVVALSGQSVAAAAATPSTSASKTNEAGTVEAASFPTTDVKKEGLETSNTGGSNLEGYDGYGGYGGYGYGGYDGYYGYDRHNKRHRRHHRHGKKHYGGGYGYGGYDNYGRNGYY